MRDKRPVDELSIEELERILAIRKREVRQARLGRYETRRVAAPTVNESSLDVVPAIPTAAPIPVTPIETIPTVEPQSIVRNGTAQHGEEMPHFEDELDNRFRPAPPNRPIRALIWNRALLAVEILAVLGLVYLFVSLFGSLQAVTQTTADIQAQYQATNNAQYVPPTATPAINIVAVVLPGGHTYDTTNNTARFNLDEVPAQYRNAYQSQILDITPAVQPTQSPQGPLEIRIPALNIDSPVVTGDSWNDLQRGVGHHVGSANPGELGNMVLSAHDDVYGEIFRTLDQLKPGDQIMVTTQLRTYTYIVGAHEIVTPNEVRVMDNSRHDAAQLTLITCTPYRVDDHRYVVYAQLQAS